MARRKLSLLVLCLTDLLAGEASPMHPPLAGGQKVEVTGTIEKVRIAPGQGMPFLELKSEKGVQRVMLCSMRYLLEKNFNPKAGSVATVKGFAVGNAIIARSVEIPSQKISIQLRDEEGMPLWRMGHHGWKEE